MTAIGILLISVPSIPNTVYILQGQTDFERTILPIVILAIVSIFSTFLTLGFQIFVYFGLTKKSKHLFSLRCLAISVLQYVFPMLFILLKVDFKYFIYAIYTNLFLRYMYVPIDILYSNNEARHHFKINHQKLLSFPRKVINCYQFFKTICCYVVVISNEVDDTPVPLEFRIVHRLRNVV